MHATVELFQLLKASTSPSFQNQKYAWWSSQKNLVWVQVPVTEKVQSLARKKLFHDWMHATVQLFQLFKASTSPSFQNQKIFGEVPKNLVYELQVPVTEKVSGLSHWRGTKFFRRLVHATVELFQLFKASTSPSFQNQKIFGEVPKNLVWSTGTRYWEG